MGIVHHMIETKKFKIKNKRSPILSLIISIFFLQRTPSLTALCTWFMMNIKLEFKYYKILNWICSCKTTVPYSAGLITTFTIDILKYLHKKVSDKHNLKSKQLHFETNFVCFCKTIPTDNFFKITFIKSTIRKKITEIY